MVDYYTLITKWAQTLADSKLLATLDQQQQRLNVLIDSARSSPEGFKKVLPDIHEKCEMNMAIENECRRRKIKFESSLDMAKSELAKIRGGNNGIKT